MDWGTWIRRDLAGVRAAGRWRTTRPFDALGTSGSLEGRTVVSFASNDYLGLSSHPEVVVAACDAAATWGAGATASRLVVGTRSLHHDLEREIAAWKACDAALVFSSGFAANLGVLTALGGRDVTIFSDELNHASIIDGCKLSRSRVAIYRHRDLDHLDDLLSAAPARTIVVTDTVFSMDGDVAPIAELQELCERRGALLVLDEAHSVLGPSVSANGDDTPLTIRIGTMSKTLGSLGGWVAGSRDVVDLLVNRARSFIFTTALTPPDTAAALVALRIVRSSEGSTLLTRLRANVDALAPGHPSPIVPIVVGDEATAVALADALLERGLLVPAIRPPTVAPGTSRLRVALSAAHTAADLATLVRALDECWPAWRQRPAA